MTLIVGLVGKGGKTLFDYYEKMAERSGWVGFDRLPEDFVECQRAQLIISASR
jgi:hypothetical protein